MLGLGGTQRECAAGRKNTYSHLRTRTRGHTRAYTGRIEYEGIAAPAGCVPAVTASELAAATRECAVHTARRREEEEEEAESEARRDLDIATKEREKGKAKKQKKRERSAIRLRDQRDH